MPASTGAKLALADFVIIVLLLLGQGNSSPTGFDGDYHPPFNVSEGEVQSQDTLCPLVELPQAFNGQVQSYSICPEDENIHIGIRNVILTPCLQNRVGLDRDVRATYSFTLTATASDGSGTDSINITLNLLDVNDNRPTFHPNTTSAIYTIPENAAMNDSVGPGPILAQDPDEGVNGTVRYWLEGCSDVFQIHTSTGLITLKAGPLDRETNASYACKVTASDLAVHDPKSTSWEFVINIGDVNDNVPQCPGGKDKFSFNVTENAMGVQFFLCAGVTDIDFGINGTVHEVTLANASLSSNVSAAYVTTGGLRVAALTVNGLDREVLGPGEDRYMIKLYITDKGTPQQTSTLYVTIVVEDVNDTPPQFEGPSMLVVPEDHASDQPVGKVTFTDPDLHSELTYSLRQSTRGHEDILLPAHISVTNNGDIFISNTTFLDFDSSLPPEIILTVEVSDGVHTTASNVTLRITDVNDNSPIFEHSGYSMEVKENVPFGTSVGNLTAHDADSGNNGAVRYTFNQTTTAPFVISESTGEITTSGPIDREMVESYSIQVIAEDNGTQPRQNVTQVTILVIDEDDNCPEFAQEEYNIELFRSDMQGPIGVVSATDKDSPAFNKVRYSLNIVMQFEINETTGTVSLRSPPSQNVTLTVTATAANVEGKSHNCSPVTARLVITVYSEQQPTPTPITSGVSSTVPIAIIVAVTVLGLLLVLGIAVACVAIILCCCVRMRRSKQYNVNNFSPATSPSEKEMAAKTKSILKSYNSEGADGKQKNSVRFVEVIEKDNIHLFQPETPVSSPELANGHLPQQQPRSNHSSELSIDSSSCEDDLSHFMSSDYSDQHDLPVTPGHMNGCYEMESRSQGYRPPTPPLSLRSQEEHIPLQELSFTPRQSESNSLPRNGYYTHHQEQQLSWSASYRPPAHQNGVDLPQRRSGTSFLSESGTSLTSDDRDSSSADIDNLSTYTEQGTDIMTQAPGPMENLFSNLQESSMLQRCVNACSHVRVCVCLWRWACVGVVSIFS